MSHMAMLSVDGKKIVIADKTMAAEVANGNAANVK